MQKNVFYMTYPAFNFRGSVLDYIFEFEKMDITCTYVSSYSLARDIDPYDPEDLRLILIKLINEGAWKIKEPITENLPVEFFKQHKFKNQGGDMETLFVNIKMAHSRRVFTLEESDKKIITKEDLEKGYICMNKNSENKKEQIPQYLLNMYI